MGGFKVDDDASVGLELDSAEVASPWYQGVLGLIPTAAV
jgi:hypothetical protein